MKKYAYSIYYFVPYLLKLLKREKFYNEILGNH
jgi:hypothetical protein